MTPPRTVQPDASRKALWRKALTLLAKVAAGAVWLVVAGVAAVFLMRIVGFEAGPASYAIAVVPWLTFAIAGLAVVVALFRQWKLTVAAGTLALLGAAWLAPLVFPGPAGGDTILTVATMNLRYGSADPDEMVAIVVDSGVDVLALEELTPEAVAALASAGLEDVLPFAAAQPAPGASGTAIYSRYPLAGIADVEGLYFETVSAHVAAPGGDIAIFAVHPRPPHPRNTDGWLEDMRALKRILADQEGPVLVAGDFNSTRDHAAFREVLALGFRDAADQAGAGFLPTYPARHKFGPLVAIDHVLTRDAGLRATSATTFTVRGTDHRAVVVQYARAEG